MISEAKNKSGEDVGVFVRRTLRRDSVVDVVAAVENVAVFTVSSVWGFASGARGRIRHYLPHRGHR